MKHNKRSFAVVFALLLSLNTGTLHARDADLASLTHAAVQTAKQQCIHTCRARYRDCLALKQIPSFECRGIYQDCTRYTCKAVSRRSTVSARISVAIDRDDASRPC